LQHIIECKTQYYRKHHFSTDLQEREILEDQRKGGEMQCEDGTGKFLIHGVKKKKKKINIWPGFIWFSMWTRVGLLWTC
jgi:hypothetical protein